MQNSVPLNIRVREIIETFSNDMYFGLRTLCCCIFLSTASLVSKEHVLFQIVGHSLGGGTAALLTYILREQKEFASATCFTFAPGTSIILL